VMDLRHNDGMDRVRFDADGLVPVIVQQWDTREVLMLAWMNAAALQATIKTGWATYYSRSRASLWIKGATSGHHQHVKGIQLDCDGDALLLLVDQTEVACHTGLRSCFDTAQIELT
jgi:phosphoribosyl-AMP cyclohydrolase